MKKIITIIFVLSLISACEIADKISNIGSPDWVVKYENLILTADTINLAKEVAENIPEVFSNTNNKLVFNKESSNNNTINISSAATGDSVYNFTLGKFYVQKPENKTAILHEGEEYTFSGSSYNYTSSYLTYSDFGYMIIDSAEIKLTVNHFSYNVALSNVVVEILNDASNEIISPSDTLFETFNIGALSAATSSNPVSATATKTYSSVSKKFTQKIKFRVKATVTSGTKFMKDDYLSINLAFTSAPRVTAANAKLYNVNFSEIKETFPLVLSKDVELYRAVVDAQEASAISIKIKASYFGKDINLKVYSDAFPNLDKVITVPACFDAETTTNYTISLSGLIMGDQSTKIDALDLKMKIDPTSLIADKGKYRSSAEMTITSSFGKITYQEVVGIVRSDIELTSFSNIISMSDKYPYFGKKYQNVLTKLTAMKFFSNNYYLKYGLYIPINSISGASLSNLLNIPITMSSSSNVSSNVGSLSDTINLNISSLFIDNTYSSSKSDSMFNLLNILPNKINFSGKVNIKSTGTEKIRIYCGNSGKFKSKVSYYADLGISTLNNSELLSSDTILYIIPTENGEKKVKTIDTKISASKLENMDSVKIALVYKNLTATPILADIIFSSDKSFIYNNHDYFTSLDNLIANNSTKIKRINTGYLKPNTGLDTVYFSINKEFLSLFDGEAFSGTFIHYKNKDNELVHDYLYLKTYLNIYMRMDL